MVVGTLDRISRNGAQYTLGGWAYKEVDAVRYPVSIIFNGETDVTIIPIERVDFTSSNKLGFLMDVDTRTLLSLLFDFSAVIASDEMESLQLKFWRECSIKAIRFIVEDWVANDDFGGIEEVLKNQIEQLLGGQISEPLLGCSSFKITVGAKSLLQDVVAGMDGFLFLYSGSNSLHSQYGMPLNRKLLDTWRRIIEQRSNFCKNLGIKFMQLIIPEKQSVCGDKYPHPIGRNTVICQELMDAITSADFFVDVDSELRRVYQSGKDVYRKIDTHFAIDGVMAVLRVILMHFGLDLKIDANKIVELDRGGDLGDKFFRNGGFSERVTVPQPGYVISASTDVIEEKVVDVEGHIGNERLWRCENAPINKKVLVFGNSFFERGTDPLSLSYWCCRLFRSVYFLWSPDMSESIVQHFKPDVVICQTVERFLPYAPNA